MPGIASSRLTKAHPLSFLRLWHRVSRTPLAQHLLKLMQKQIKFLLLLLFSVGNYTQNSTGVNFNIAYTLTDKYVLSVCACVQTEHWQIGYGIAAGLGCRQDWKFRFNRTPGSEADVLALGCITQMLPFFLLVTYYQREYQREIKMKSAERIRVLTQPMTATEMCETGLLTSATLHTCRNLI